MVNLFNPINIGPITVKNRFVRSATQDWFGNDDGSITQREIMLYEELAKNDVGMIVSAHSYVEHPRGRASARQNGIYHDRFIEGFSKIAEKVHDYGTKLIVQLAHAGTQTNLEFTEGCTPADPNMLSQQEIESIIESFALAARRVQQAGCDGVQFHLAHGYLLARILSPHTNMRQDEWGGSIENRAKMIISIIKHTRHLVGEDFPLLVKLNSCGGFEGTAAIEMSEVVAVAKMLETAGINAIEVSGGVVGESKNSMSRTGILKPEDEAYFAKAARTIKQAVAVPVILVGGLRSRWIMEDILRRGVADMISMSRPFIREPDLVKKIAQGQEKVRCISCNQCRDTTGIHCIFNNK